MNVIENSEISVTVSQKINEDVDDKNIQSKRAGDKIDEDFEPKRKVRKKSTIWNHFKRLKKSKAAKCKYCSAKIKRAQSNTTSLWNHYKRKHAEKDGEERRASKNKTGKEEIEYLSTDSERHKQLTEGIAYMMAKDLRPYSIVENAGFTYLMSKAEPRYKIPSRNTFSRTVMPKIYEKERTILHKKLCEDMKGWFFFGLILV